jgi:signal transduction histidine kinase
VTAAAQASEMRVTTGATGGWVSVSIADNGRGLSNQQRCAQAVGGYVEFDSSLAGTRLILHLQQRRLTAAPTV